MRALPIPNPMKTNFLDLVVSLPQTFLENGISPQTPRDLQKKIQRLNLFLAFALVIAFTSLVFSYRNQLFVSAMVHLGAVFLITVAFFLNKDGMVRASKAVGIVTVNLHLFIISHMEGLRSGTYLMIFPLLVAIVFIIETGRPYREIAITGLLILTNTLMIFLLSPYENQMQKIAQELYSGLHTTNLAISLTLTSIFAYIILKTFGNHEEKILDEKNLSETIYDTSLDAVFIVKASDGMVTGCNRRSLELFGYGEKAEVLGGSVESLLGPKIRENIGACMQQSREGKGPWYGNMELNRRDDMPFYGYVNIVPFHHGQQLYVKISILDITEIKVAEFEIVRAKEKAERATLVKSRFLSMMSHELRTPLNGIIGTVNLMLQEPTPKGDAQYMDVLKHSSEHMLKLIDDILDFSKLEADKLMLELRPFNLKDFLDKAATPFMTPVGSEAGGVALHVELGGECDVEVVSDELRLNQILNNLLSNARKFTEKGRITLRAEMEDRSHDMASVRFSVSDTGIGIPPNKIRQIFESFTQADAETTRKYGGTGLGLAISRNIVERMGGELKVHSLEGVGSEFHFILPLRLGEARTVPKADPVVSVLTPLTGLRVLIAEDNPVNMVVARRFLQKWEITVGEALDGRELLQRFHEKEYDLLLVDLEMPEMDGAEAVAVIRRTHPEIPVIAFTAAVYEDIRNDLLRKGFDDFIPKPFRPEHLHSKIRELTIGKGWHALRCG
jgi:PAS domain S-box-containing protein